MAKTQLQKSHSVWSNTKLTVLSLFMALFFCLFFIVLALKSYFDFTLWLVLLAISFGFVLIGFIGFNVFKR